ncbi:response regulator [uncultured Abiotrophia sp.]|uniref:response regulator n=1 Tax=uncultured Abiotrophia sp. TaxID=316094 RepID=UPI0028D7129E|nr:response regulator [uncultured Abiotrophia sp.]
MAPVSFQPTPLRVLIVDDEYMIVKGLERLIRWQELGLQLVGTAGNGQEALDLMCHQAVDIVITDVNMPNVTGIDFISQAKDLGQDFVFIFVSGYQEFEYVKRGMELGAKNYLLKPIDKVELHRVLSQVAQEIRDKRALAQVISDHEQAQLTSWLEIGQGSLPLRYQDVTAPNWQWVLAQKTCQPQLLAAGGWSIMVLGDWLLGIIPQSDFKQDPQDSGMQIQTNLSLTNIHHKLQAFLQAESRRLFYEWEWDEERARQIFWQNESDASQTDPTTVKLVDQLVGHLYEAIDNQNSIKLDADLDSFLAFCQEQELAPQEVVQLTALIRHYFDIKSNQHTPTSLLDEGANQPLTFASLSQHLKESLDLGGREKRHHLYPPIVNEVLAAIYERYNENISMKSLADDLHVNVMYLGQLFKREVGMTLSRYINQYRLAIAKDLLIASKLSVAQIAVKVGYQNQAYFYRVFK